MLRSVIWLWFCCAVNAATVSISLPEHSYPFHKSETGYLCLRVPVLLRTVKGTVLAFAEARKLSCSDHAATDLVLKRSSDDGATWGDLQVVQTENSAVIGNAAPVQLRSHISATHPQRILVPYTRNNSDVWLTWSDDDGVTWPDAKQVFKGQPGWNWLGTGPPGSLQLSTGLHVGRVLVPAYRSYWRSYARIIVHAFLLISDDDGESWRLNRPASSGNLDSYHIGENQLVELGDGSVLMNGRTPSIIFHQERVQAISHDGGDTFRITRHVPELPQPFFGCEGSIIRAAGKLYFSGPDSHLLRTGLTLWSSEDDGTSWHKVKLIDAGMTGYSSLISLDNNTLGLMHEESNEFQVFDLVPQRFKFHHINIATECEMSESPLKCTTGTA